MRIIAINDKERKNPSSLLNCYKRLLDVRKNNPVLSEGLFKFIEYSTFNGECLNYKRFNDEDEIYIYLNFSKNDLLIPCPVESPNLAFSTLSNRVALDIEAYNGNIKLTPFEGIIFK